MDFRIRPASVHDADAMAGIRPAAEPGESDAEVYRRMIDSPGTPRAGTWVAEVEGKVVGFAHFREAAEPETADLVLLCLRPESRGTGVARPLLDGVLDDMRTLSFHRVRAEIPPDAPGAERFLERAGFRWAQAHDYRLGL